MREPSVNKMKEICIMSTMFCDKKGQWKLEETLYLLYLKNIGKYFVFLNVEVI